MKLLSWLWRPVEWLIDRVLDGMRSGSHRRPQPPQRRSVSRDPGTGRWVVAPDDEVQEDTTDEGSENA